MRSIHRWSLIVVVVGAFVACKKGGVADLAEKNRAKVDAFATKLLRVDAKMASAPTDASGLKLAPGETIRMWGHDQPDNTVVIAPNVFRMIADHAVREPTLRSGIDPATSLDLFWLFARTASPEDSGDQANTLTVYKRVLAWYPNLRYVAVPIVTKKRDYSAESSSDARWEGRIAVYDLVGDAWVGAVGVALDGGAAEINEYVTVDASTNKELSGPYKLVDRDLSSARYKFNGQLDDAVKQALETGTSITSKSQLASKR